jgi:hypothetical protein
MKRATLALVFAGAFAAALAATMPASLALSLLGSDAIGLSAADVSGSIWNGRLKLVQYRGIPLGDVGVSLDARALISGARRLTVQGPRGEATLVESDSRGFERATIAIAIEHLNPPMPIAGRLRLENVTLLFSGARCARAEGRIATDALERALRGPEVSGRLSCAGDAAVAQLEGRTQDLDVSIAVRLEAAGRYQLETRVVSVNPVVRGALALAGFTENGGGFTRSDEGAFGT